MRHTVFDDGAARIEQALSFKGGADKRNASAKGAEQLGGDRLTAALERNVLKQP